MAHQMAIRLQGAQVRTWQNGSSCSRQARVTGDDAGPTARVTEGFGSLGPGIASTPRTGLAAGAGGAGVGPASLSTSLAPSSSTPTPFRGHRRRQRRSRCRKPCSARRCRMPIPTGRAPSLWIVPPGPKRTISTFVGRSTTQVLVGKTESGQHRRCPRHRLRPHQGQPRRAGCRPTSGLLIDPDYVPPSRFLGLFASI